MLMVDLMQGNCLDKLKELNNNSVDSIVCDPPYELGFMGKKWDNTGITYNVEMWAECLRVLKYGGHLLAFGGTRTYHRMACAIEDAGFEIRDMIEWCYGSGFPKSLNIGKAVDKLDAKDVRRARNLSFTSWMRSSGITVKQINEATESFMGAHYLTEREQPAVATLNMFEKIKNLLPDPPIEIMQLMKERTIESENFKKREVIGKTITNKTVYQRIGQENESGEIDITKGTSEWEGWGTALKPAHEPICMARKPLAEKSVAENVLKYGTGGINIDESRVDVADNEKIKQEGHIRKGNVVGDNRTSIGAGQFGDGAFVAGTDLTNGRFPANLIHDGSDEVKKCFPDESERFFKSIIYTAKASKSERNNGCEELEEKERIDYGGFHSEKGLIENNRNPENRLPNKNNHPTVKPIALMEYLIKMITPKGGVVLDPFMGSGTTGVACNNLDYNFIGIEFDTEYFKIAEKRINNYAAQQEFF